MGEPPWTTGHQRAMAVGFSGGIGYDADTPYETQVPGRVENPSGLDLMRLGFVRLGGVQVGWVRID
jgi:hypothetical protein